jgi:ubiquinone biosynthesis protein
MKPIKLFFRLCYIQWVAIRFGVDQFILRLPFFFAIRFLAYLNPFYWLQNKRLARGVRIRRMLETLGPIFVKFGQILSTRYDFLPTDIIKELEKLQDKVPPFPSKIAIQLIETSLKKPLHEVFSEIDHAPLASASIAQVHAAKLLDGSPVIIKVLRPGIEKIIRHDVRLLFFMARLANRFWPACRRFRPVEMVAELQSFLEDEQDLTREAANASQLKRNFSDSQNLYVPCIYWDYCHRNILVMERIYGIPLNDDDAIAQSHVDQKYLAALGVNLFFTQILTHRFFHADMHPGNVFLDVKDPNNPHFIVVDFGIMGSLDESDQRYIAENLLAFFRRDYHHVAKLHIESGWVPAHIRVDQFEGAIRAVCEPIFNRPIQDISFAKLLLSLIQTARRYEMRIQPQLLLLQKTLLNIEALGRRLDPTLNLWETAKPILEKWVKERSHPKALFKTLREQAPLFLKKLPEISAALTTQFSATPRSTAQTVLRPRFSRHFFVFFCGLLIGVAASLLPLYHYGILIF